MANNLNTRVSKLEGKQVEQSGPPVVFLTVYEGQMSDAQSAVLMWPDGATKELRNISESDAEFRALTKFELEA